jgi:outer membrane PBP1 activator LpoA protein
MPMHHLHSRAAVRLAALALAAGLLAGCAGTDPDATARFLVAPGKYVLFNCAQIAQQAQDNGKRQHELEALMVKAGNESSGQLVSAVAYRPEYLQLRGEMTDLRQVAADKKCKFVPSAAQSAQPVSTGALH